MTIRCILIKINNNEKKDHISILYFILIHLISKCCNLLQEYLLCSYCVVIVPISDYYFFCNLFNNMPNNDLYCSTVMLVYPSKTPITFKQNDQHPQIRKKYTILSIETICRELWSQKADLQFIWSPAQRRGWCFTPISSRTWSLSSYDQVYQDVGVRFKPSKYWKGNTRGTHIISCGGHADATLDS